MKFSKLLSAVLVSSTIMAAMPSADATSIGRSSGSSSSGSRSSSSSSSSKSSSFSAPSRPSTPAAAPAPSRPGGIGGTAGSMGVRKSEVTSPVAQKVEQGRPATDNPNAGKAGSFSAPNPTYGSANQPNYGGGGYSAPPSPGLGAGGVFASSLGGSLVGSMIGNSLFGGGHGGGTTVINNGTPSGGSVASGGSGAIVDSNGFTVAPNGQMVGQQQKESYGMGKLIVDVILFAILVGLLVGIAYLFYKGYKMVNAYVKRERGIGPSQPFNPTQKFWEIQKAFAAADVEKLATLLGPDLVDEATANIVPNTITLSKVSHEIVLSNPREFSIHYTFEDDGATIDQVFHYELHEGTWKLNGIETV